MDFHTFFHSTPLTMPEAFLRYMSDRRRQLQDWEAEPPHRLGWTIFGLVVFEGTLAQAVFHQWGLGRQFVLGLISNLFTVFILTGIIVKVTHEIGGYLHKKGDWKSTWTFFNLGLYPMLLFFPIGFFLWLTGASSALRAVVFFILLLKVIHNWRESLEVTFELSAFQSALVMYAGLGLLLLMIVIISYLALLNSLARLFS